MVKICSNSYPKSNEEKYNQYFEKYPFPLSSFQKYAIEAIVENNHILVTAHTGSGKTLPAEFAIEHFVSKGKKVIYTSPIKALSNQKFYEFTSKFPHISFGILTGDIKSNPEADVLIMTTEILLNTLYAKNRKDDNTSFTNQKNNLTMFEMDFENELACVVFDEIHYINDPDRGKIWEETIMMLPLHIQMVMLSATLDSPEKFALWCETRGQIQLTHLTNKIVYLTSTYERVVPLTHYSFITCTQGLFKILKDKQLEMEIMKITNSLQVIQDAKGIFNDLNYQKIKKTLKTLQDKNHYVKRQHVLNTVAKHMFDNNMLPAICFVLSRKALEQCAKEINISLLEDDSKVPYIVRRECEQIIRKLPNYQEYLNLPEYLNIVSLLEKGVAIHHAGIMPILREMVELLFAKGYIKLLFATETFAVGINMPTKTVLFTDANKFDGTSPRILYSHEYTQMAGRAGRRGIDTVGHVIHLTNLFRNTDQIAMKTMMKGKPQSLTSKFKISYNLILNLIDIGEKDYTKYVKRSMIQGDIENNMKECYMNISKLQAEIDNSQLLFKNCKTPKDIVDDYIQLKVKLPSSVNKKRKEIERTISQLKDEYKNIEKDAEFVSKYNSKFFELDKLNEQMFSTENGLQNNIKIVLNMLSEKDLIKNENDTNVLTIKGHIASSIREVHCLIFAELIESGKLKQFKPEELVGILSCFTNITVPEDKCNVLPNSNIDYINKCIIDISNNLKNQSNIEMQNLINTGSDYNIHFDLIDYAIKWCHCKNDIECKELLQTISLEKEIFLGEFVKALLKVNNISSEMEKIAENLGDIEFLSILKEIPILTLKYVATNQSLYV
uniref:Helicase n=1 Tax=viral metagenome TaxID=1070528 RepID=A0A6C0KQ18_9ZZZZ